jgi:hypothetical protein
MKIPLNITNTIIVSRRPMYCDIEPARAPPLWKDVEMSMDAQRKAGVSDTPDGSAIADDGCDDRMVVIQTFARLEICRVQILRTM